MPRAPSCTCAIGAGSIVSVIASLGFPDQWARRRPRPRRPRAGPASCRSSSILRSTSHWATTWPRPPIGWPPSCRASWPDTRPPSSSHPLPTTCITGTRRWAAASSAPWLSLPPTVRWWMWGVVGRSPRAQRLLGLRRASWPGCCTSSRPTRASSSATTSAACSPGGPPPTPCWAPNASSASAPPPPAPCPTPRSLTEVRRSARSLHGVRTPPARRGPVPEPRSSWTCPPGWTSPERAPAGRADPRGARRT